MSNFTPGDRVRLLVPPEALSTWQGLTATVIVTPTSAPTNRIMICLDGERPDGHIEREFFWQEEYLEKIEESDTVKELRAELSRLVSLRTETAREHQSELEILRADLRTARLDLENFKTEVVEVASRYAIENDWCSVVAKALEELGLEATRTVEVQVSGTASITVPLGVTASIESSVSSLTLNLDSDYDHLSVDLDDISVSEI